MLFERLPARLYEGSGEVRALQEAIEEETHRFLRARDGLLAQFILARAGWGLSKFEREYGIFPDSEKTDGERRAAVRAKKRGRGTITLPVLYKVAQSFSDEPVEIIEYPPEYRIQVETGESSLIRKSELRKILTDIVPAHLLLQQIIYFESDAQNTMGFRAVSLHLRSRFSNFMQRPVLFDGRANFDGSIRFDQQIVGRFFLRSLQLRARLESRESIAANFIVRNRAENTRRLCARELVVWNAGRQREKLYFKAYTVRMIVRELHGFAIGSRFFALAENRNVVGSGFMSLHGAARTAGRPNCRKTLINCRMCNRNTTSAQLITNTMYTFGGGYAFDGTRRFNADVVTEEL